MERPRRAKLLLVVLGFIFVLIVVALAFFPKTANPAYKGVKLTEWLRLYHLHVERSSPSVFIVRGSVSVINPGIGPEDLREREAEDALRAIGKDGVPLLMEWYTAKPNAFKLRMIRTLFSVPGAPSSWRGLFFRMSFPTEHQKNVIAYNVLKMLGPDASPAMPQLEELASKAIDDDDATELLRSIGPAALPALSNALRLNKVPARRVQILYALSSFGPAAGDAVTNIIPLLQEFDPAVAGGAARALGEIHQHSEVAVPALVSALGLSSALVQGRAISALGQFGGNASDAVIVLSNYCADPVLGEEAKVALKKIREASSNNPVELEGPFLSVP